MWPSNEAAQKVCKFEVGGVYSYCNIPFKVTQITYTPTPAWWSGSPVWNGGAMWVRQVHHRFCRYIEIVEIAGNEAKGFSELAVNDDANFTAWDFHCLHTFFFQAAIQCAKPTCVMAQYCRSGCVASTRIS